MQRDRDFARYEDLEARYDRRPSAWVEPKGKWGAGHVELVQIPTPDETNDNIVAFWVPDTPPTPHKPFDVEYRLLWQKDSETRPPLSWVAQTRRGHGYSRGPDPTIGFVIDFDGPALRKLAADAPVEAVVDRRCERRNRRAHCPSQRCHRRLAREHSGQAHRRRQTGRVAGISQKRGKHTIGNVELRSASGVGAEPDALALVESYLDALPLPPGERDDLLHRLRASPSLR